MRCYILTRVLVALAALLHTADVNAALTVPHATDTTGARAAEVSSMAARIKNEPRTLAVGQATMPFYTGPQAPPGSLAMQLRVEEAARVNAYLKDMPATLAALVQPELSKLKSPADIAALYDLVKDRAPRPVATDISDENFGAQRLSLLAMKLRQVDPTEFTTIKFQLGDRELTKICGRGFTSSAIQTQKNLFVEDYSDAAQWNDPMAVDTKYVPNVVGYFCYNRESRKLLPVEIQYPNTCVNYSPMDAEDEWTLAKMGLNAASVSFHQWHHLGENHAVAVAIRVELLRTMAAVHPVRALLAHHMAVDIGLEMLIIGGVLSTNTSMDQTFGWGATGGIRFIDRALTSEISIANHLPKDLSKRGLTGIPTHKYATYGNKLYSAITKFAKSYVHAYYGSNKAVIHDFELQNWAAACALVPHLRDFPTKIHKRSDLIKLLTHLVFQSAVKHHAINGLTTWHTLAPPYSPSALWKKMPSKKLAKGEKLDLMAYTVPASKLQVALGIQSYFYRPAPANETLMHAYRVEPFASETCLQAAIAEFEVTLGNIDAFIAKNEKHEKHPYELLRPSVLPFDSWA